MFQVVGIKVAGVLIHNGLSPGMCWVPFQPASAGPQSAQHLAGLDLMPSCLCGKTLCHFACKDCTRVVNLLSEEKSFMLQVKISNNLECPFLSKKK